MANDSDEHHHSHTHGHDHGHGHGNEHDQGFEAMLRYARHARSMWTSDINEAVVGDLALSASDRVADIGAGVGAGSVVAAQRAAHVYAIEPTSYMRRILGARVRLARKPITIVDGAAEATGLAPNSIDAVMAVNTMHHWTDMSAAAAELHRVLRRGGRFVLVDEDFENPEHPEFDKWGNGEEHTHHFHTVDVEAVSSVLAAVGFAVSTADTLTMAGRPCFVLRGDRQ